MEHGNGDESLREEALDAGLRALFGAKDGTGESVLAAIEEATGASAQVLLRDPPEDESPLLKLHPPDSEEAAKDDCRYQVVGEIARGGVGVIFKGRDRDLGRDVAIKVLRSEHAARPEIVQRFIEEAQIEGQLQHPGIIPVYGLGLQPDGRPYFAMKLVKGKTLSAVLSERKDPNEDRSRYLAMFEQVAQAMAYAHTRGVIHRDLKPSNILIGAFGEVLVVDWGFAKVLGTKEPEAPKGPATPPLTIVATVRTGTEGSQSIAGSVMGTPAYMPPEQALGHVEQLDTRSDVFALGAILAEILTGQPPYVGESDDQLVMASQARLDDALRRLDACGADPVIVTLCKKCLAPLKGDRPRDASAPAMAISEHLVAQEERAREAEVEAAREKARAVKEKSERERERSKETSERRKVKWERLARRRTIGVAAALLLAVILGGGAFLKMQGDKRTRAEHAQATVARAVEEAELLRGEKRWPEAIEKARGAMELARVEGVSDAIRAETAGLLEAIGAEQTRTAEQAARFEKDKEFAARLEEIYLGHAEGFDATRTDAAFEAAFRKYGIDIDLLGVEEAGLRVAATTRAVEIAARLDTWGWLAYIREDIDRNPQALLEAARIADPDPFRVRIRRATAEGDRPTLLKIAQTAQTEDLPPETLDCLATWLGESGETEVAIQVLRHGQRRHPDSFWINYHLGVYLSDLEPYDGAAIRYATAATALRPESARAWNLLGSALNSSGNLDAAAVAWRRAILAEPDAYFAQANLVQALRFKGNLEAADALARQALGKRPDAAELHVALGGVRVAEGDLEAAIEAYQEAIRLDPKHYSKYVGLSFAYQLVERLEEAKQAAREGLGRCRLNVDRARCLMAMGYAQTRAGDLEAGLQSCDQAVRLDPRSCGAQRVRCSALTELRRFEEAVAAGREGVRLSRYDSERAVCLTELGPALGLAGKPDKAIEVLREAIELCPELKAAYPRLANAYLTQGEYRKAVEAGREGLKHGGHERERAECLIVIGRGLVAIRQSQKALDSFRRAIDLWPGNLEARMRLGQLLSHHGELDEAERAYRELLSIDPTYAVGHVGLGNVYLNKGDPDKAEAAYREALHHNERAEGAWGNLGALYRARGEYPEAIRMGRKAVALAPGQAFTHLYLGETYQAAGRWKEAIEKVCEAVRLNPNDWNTRNHLAWYLATCPEEEFRDPAAAILHAEKAVELAPALWNLRNTLGVALYRGGKWARARDAFEKSLELGSGNAGDHLYLAMALWQLGDREKARECYEAALALAKEAPLVDPENYPGDLSEAEALLGIEKEGR